MYQLLPRLIAKPLIWRPLTTIRFALRKGQQLRRRNDQSNREILSLLTNDLDGGISKRLEQHLMPVTAVTIGELIDFKKVVELLRPYKFTEVIPDEVINVNINQTTDLMVLSNGTLVGWNLSEEIIIHNYGQKLAEAVEHPYVPEADSMDWIGITNVDPKALYLKGEIFVVGENDLAQATVEKAAFAIGFSRLTRLSILENALDRCLGTAKNASKFLASGTIVTNEESVLKLTGRLFQLRAQLNLYLELIETPDMYWEEPLLELIYTLVSRALDINPRIAILNRKLDYATDEQRAFLLVLNEKKSTRLEWIIILLITVEVVFELRQFWLEYKRSD